MYVQANYEQLVGEVKERNKVHKTLKEIREISSEAVSLQEIDECKKQFLKLVSKCDDAFEGVI